MRLKDKKIIVTAAAQGIGRATAIQFAKEGASIIATDINEKKLSELKNENLDIKIEKLDATNKTEVESFCSSINNVDVLFDELEKFYKKIEKIINSKLLYKKNR